MELLDLIKQQVYRSGTGVTVKQHRTRGSVVVMNGISVSGGRNMSIINGEVWIDGRRVDPNNQNQSAEQPQPRVRLYAPQHVDLEADLCSVSLLASKVIFRKARLDVSGQATVGIAAVSLKLDLSGQGNNFVVLRDGDLDVDVSGQGKVQAKGTFSSVDAAVSGMGNIVTTGECRGDYRASVSGMGSISHNGAIHGRVKKSVSGMGSINI